MAMLDGHTGAKGAHMTPAATTLAWVTMNINILFH